jgi:hypothetical protein
MKYQLVLQWAIPFPIQDIDDIVAIEDLVIDELKDSADVDGHDFGSEPRHVGAQGPGGEVLFP